MSKRIQEINSAIEKLEAFKNDSTYAKVAYAIDENVVFMKSIKRLTSYVWWLIAHSKKTLPDELLELTDFPVEEWDIKMHRRLIEIERNKHIGLGKPLVDKITAFVLREDRPLVLVNLGAGGMEVDRQVIASLIEGKHRHPTIFIGVDKSLTTHKIAKENLGSLGGVAVIERERILDILREIQFGGSKCTDPASAPEEGKLLSVRYLIEGSMGLNEDRTLKDTLDAPATYKDMETYQPGLLDNLFNPAGVRRTKMVQALQDARKRRAEEQKRRAFPWSCYLSVYDVRTGEVKTSVMGLGGNGLEAIRDAVEELIDDLVEKDDGIRVASVFGDKVYLDIGSTGGIKAGDKFQVVHLGKEIRNRHGQVLGHEETEVGEIEVTDTQDYLSIAKPLAKAGAIARGDICKPAKH